MNKTLKTYPKKLKKNALFSMKNKKKNDIERQEMAYRYQQKDIKRLEDNTEGEN